MASSMIDSELFKDYFGTADMRQVFSDENQIQKWMDCEAALARVEARLGIIPSTAAEEISRKAHVSQINIGKIKQEIDKTGHPFIALVSVFKTLCEGRSGEYLHWGATTQDILDSGLILQLREAYQIIERKLETVYDAVCEKAQSTRNIIMVGRTNGQQAIPITLGFKFAVWGFELQRQQQRLTECRERLLVGQFAGAVGTVASLGSRGIEVQEAFFAELGLNTPPIAWFTSRDSLVEFASVLAQIATTLGKIGNEVYALQKGEIGELEEYSGGDSIGSSTMPHKRNPFNAMQIVTLAKLTRSAAASMMDAAEQEHERDCRGMQVEWDALPRACLLTDAALDKSIHLVRNLVVKPQQIEKNLGLLRGLIFSEAAMLKLAQTKGRQTAHHIIHRLAMQAIDEGVNLRHLLRQDPETTELISEHELDEIFEPKHYIGFSLEFVDRLINSRASRL
ncbi:adenylosuccinate lyase [Pectobacterium brasiliense]|uniref:adenylosuccinate lyase n=1 Tax=Pectobacterium TaxID=122277 RepID=UPI001F27841C|nr:MULTISPECIES: adenylosuccinate lyase [Pectobacterium]